MRILSRFRKSTKPDVTTNITFKEAGIIIEVNKQGDLIDLPIKLTLSEYKQLDNLEQLQLIEDLELDGIIDRDQVGTYVLPYEYVYDLTSEEKELLNLPPKSTAVTIHLDNKGFVGSRTFKFLPQIESDQYKNLHEIGERKGAIIKLPTDEVILLPKDYYYFLEKIDQQPSRENYDQLASYIAEVKKMAQDLNVSQNEYLQKENYEFVDELSIDVQRTDDGLDLIPTFEHENLEPETLNDLNESGSNYIKHGDQRVFVKKDTIETREKVAKLDTVLNKDIPKLVQNPAAFIPEDIDVSLDKFSDRVKSLGIRVYQAQPFVHADQNELGWFEFKTGYQVKDVEGNPIAEESDDFFTEQDTNPYKQLDENTFIEVPKQAVEFNELSSKIKEQAEQEKSSQLTPSNYILEIFENITHVEYNKPLKNMQQTLQDEAVFDPTPPALFHAKLKPFQEEGFTWMKTLSFVGNGGLLADDMGLGKTVQVIAYLTYLKEQDALTPSLLILPKSLIYNWVHELEKFAPKLTEKIYIHTGPDRLNDHKKISVFDIVLTTYHTLARDQFVLGQVDWEVVICDEAQMIKNPTTANSAAVKALKNKGRIALTGTPVENNLSELWSIIDFVQPGTLGSLTNFKNEYEQNLKDEDESKYSEIQRSIEDRIRYIYLRRTKEGELKDQLPSKTEHKLITTMGREQKRMYMDIINQVENKEIQGLEAIQRLKMLCSHPGLVNDEYSSLRLSQVPKLEKTIQILRDIQKKNEKVIIFTEYRKMQAIIKREVITNFNIDVPIINGSINNRQQIIDQFNTEPGFGVLILSPRSAGTGLTITSANHVIHYTRWWNPAVENQATDRVYRIGQEKDVHVYYPIVENNSQGRTVEKIIDELITKKNKLASNVIVPSEGSIEQEVLQSIEAI